MKRIVVATVAVLGLLGIASCGSKVTSGEEVITATDLDAAAEAVLAEQLPETAEALTVAEVKADAIKACAAIADVPNSATGPAIVAKVGGPEYAAAVEAEGDNDIDNVDFFTRELPYIVSIGKHFCPAEAVRANVI